MKVLIIDDSLFMRTLIKRTLATTGAATHEVREAGDAEEALLMCRKFRPDLFLVDLNLPGMSGLDLIETLQRESPRAKFGIITSSKGPELNEQARAVGAVFVLSKPFTKSALLEVLKRALS